MKAIQQIKAKTIPIFSKAISADIIIFKAFKISRDNTHKGDAFNKNDVRLILC
jgi:hypothetical protein